MPTPPGSGGAESSGSVVTPRAYDVRVKAEQTRTPLTRERVLRTAVDLADQRGIDALTIRRLGEQLGVEAMSLYYHVANKEDLLDGVVDLVVGEIDGAAEAVARPGMPRGRPRPGADPRRAGGDAAAPVGAACWTPGRLASPPSATTTGWSARWTGGFSYDLAHHALHALGSRVFGFSQELFDPDAGRGAGRAARAADGRPGADLAAMLRGRPRRPRLDARLVRRPVRVRVRARPVLDGLERAGPPKGDSPLQVAALGYAIRLRT